MKLQLGQPSLKGTETAQVGGMGDVVTALARAVQDEGHQVTCILPKYDCLNYKEVSAQLFLRTWGDAVEGLFLQVYARATW